MKNLYIKAQHYHDQSQKMRALAASEENDEFRNALLDVAESYERHSAKMLEAAKRAVANNP